MNYQGLQWKVAEGIVISGAERKLFQQWLVESGGSDAVAEVEIVTCYSNGEEEVKEGLAVSALDYESFQQWLDDKGEIVKGLVLSALDRELFQQWLSDKEDWEEVGLTNTGTGCPLNTYLKTKLSKEGYEAYDMPQNVTGSSLPLKARYDLHLFPDKISLDCSDSLEDFEIDTPHWASAFIVEVDKLANTPEIPDDTSDRKVPVTKAECEALLRRITA